MTPTPKVIEAVARWYASCAFEMDIDRMTAMQRAACETEAATFLNIITPLIVANAVKARREAYVALAEAVQDDGRDGTYAEGFNAAAFEIANAIRTMDDDQ
jgi:hypothetical protein